MTSVSADRLAQVFAEVTDVLVDDFDLIEFLRLVTTRTADLVDAAAVGVLLADPQGELRFMAASDEATRLLELFQVQHHDGPCQDAYATGLPVVNADLREAAARWPVFAPRAAADGYRAVHAIPMRHRRTTIGALNLFSTDAGLFDDGDVAIVQALADVATAGLLQVRLVHEDELLTQQLQGALDSRALLEQAKGAVARTYGVSVDAAAELMEAYVRRHRSRLSDVALEVVRSRGGRPRLVEPRP